MRTEGEAPPHLPDVSAEREVLETVLRMYEAMREKDPDRLISVHSRSGYTLYNDAPPHDLLEGEMALRLKLSLMSQVQDLTYEVREQRVTVLGDFAVVTYELEMSGVLVYSYRFEGSHWARTARCTAVLRREEGGWVIIHEHYSPAGPTRSTT